MIFLLPFTVAAVIALPLLHRSLDMLRFEEDVARSFGLSYRLHFSLVLLTACGLAASAVGTVGPLIFVGLVVPHLAHFLAGRRFGMVIDGPFAETKEQLLGLYVVDCPSIEAAVETARELRRVNPTAVYEIRPISLYLPGATLSAPADNPA